MNWKKEYKVSDLLKREDAGKASAEQPPAPPASGDENVWKKEVKLTSMFRRGDSAPEGSTPARSREQSQSESSMWKKEIKLSSLFRRKREQQQPKQPLALPAPGDTLAEAPTGPVPSHPYPTQAAPPPQEPTPPPTQPVEPEQPVAPVTAVAAAAATTSEEPPVDPTPAATTVAEVPGDAGAPATEPTPVPVPPEAAAPVPEAQADGPEPTSKRKGKQSKRSGPERRERQEGPKAARPAAERKPKSGAQLPQVPLMKALNLLPQDIKLPKTTVRPWVAYAAVGAAALLVAGGMGFLYMNQSQHLADRESTLEDMDAQLTTLEARAAQAQAESTNGSALEGEEQTRATALAFALDGRRGWDRLLRELSLTLPDNVSFKAMASSTSAPAPVLPPEAGATAAPVAPAPVSSTLTITGYALTQGDVAQLLARLEVVPEFSSIQLESATRTQVDSQYVIEFSVIGELKQPVQVTP